MTGAGFRWRIFPVIRGPEDPADVDADPADPVGVDPAAPADADADPAVVDATDGTSATSRPRTCART